MGLYFVHIHSGRHESNLVAKELMRKEGVSQFMWNNDWFLTNSKEIMKGIQDKKESKTSARERIEKGIINQMKKDGRINAGEIGMVVPS